MSAALDSQEVVSVVLSGGVVVARTDTIYGLLARAQNEVAVAKVFDIKKRQQEKTAIVLISSTDQLFDALDQDFSHFWPGPNSLVLPAPSAPDWIRRSDDTVAYRMPNLPALQSLIQKTGPLIAPSANPEGLLPATTIIEAENYFGSAVDMYIDGGTVTNNVPSKIWRLTTNGTMEQLR